MRITLLAMTQPVLRLFEKYPHATPSQLQGTPQEQLIEIAGRTCYDPETEIFTERGWVKFPDLKTHDRVAAVDAHTYSKTPTFFFEKPSDLIEKDHNGSVIWAAGQKVNFVVTPDHRMWVRPRDASGGDPCEWQIMPAVDLLNGEWMLQTTAIGPNYETSNTTIGPDLSVNIHLARFLGYFLSEGSLRFPDGVGASVSIYQKPGVILDKIRAAVAGLGLRAIEQEDQRNGVIQLRISNTKLAKFLRDFGQRSYERRIPDFVFFWPIELRIELLRSLMEGDAHRIKNAWIFGSSSHGLVEDASRLATLCGWWSSSIQPIAPPKKESGSWTKLPAWRVRINQFPRPAFLKRSKVRVFESAYSGKVYCVSVSTGLVLVRRDGKQMVCGQCYDSFGRGRQSSDYHAHLLESEHGSVLEHVSFTFRIEGVSRSLTHELVRHRVGTAISQRSTRYCDEGEAHFVIHPADMPADDGSFLIDLDAQTVAAYETTVNIALENLAKKGITGVAARKQARAAGARVLPHGLETELIWTCNVRALRAILDQRATDPADAEIRAMAVEMWKIAKEHVPSYLDDFEVWSAEDGLGFVLHRRASVVGLRKQIENLKREMAIIKEERDGFASKFSLSIASLSLVEELEKREKITTK